MALAGENGAGKSTLVKLLLRLMDNVILGDPVRPPDMARVEEAARRSRLAEILEELELGLESMAGPMWAGRSFRAASGSGRLWPEPFAGQRRSSSSASRRPPSTPRRSWRCSSASWNWTATGQPF